MGASYSIQAVAERTGLTPHVIRAWERRYRAIEPERSAGRHRLYSDAEIERLQLLRRAVESGRSIGQIARLPDSELSTIAGEMPPSIAIPSPESDTDPTASFRSAAIRAVTQFDARTLEDTLQLAQVKLGNNGLLRRIIAPLAEDIGERWRIGELTAAHEHFFTANVKMFLGDLARQFATPPTAPRIIVGTPAGQFHELGAIMAAAAAANLGWRAIYLGPSLPAHEIAGAAISNKATAVALSIVYPQDDPNLPRELTELSRLLPATIQIVAGGRAARGYLDTLFRIGAIYADSIGEFADRLDILRNKAPGIVTG